MIIPLYERVTIQAQPAYLNAEKENVVGQLTTVIGFTNMTNQPYYKLDFDNKIGNLPREIWIPAHCL